MLKHLFNELDQAFVGFQTLYRDYHYTAGEKILISKDHEIVDALLAETKAHPLFEKRYVTDLKDFTPLSKVEKATQIDRVIAGDKFVGSIEPILAIDCEMVQTANCNMALARLSAVNVFGEKVIDVLVLPCHYSYIEDCRTWITGINLQGKYICMITSTYQFHPD